MPKPLDDLPILAEHDGWVLYHDPSCDSSGWRALRFVRPASAAKPGEIRNRIYKFGWHPLEERLSRVHDLSEIANRWPQHIGWLGRVLPKVQW